MKTDRQLLFLSLFLSLSFFLSLFRSLLLSCIFSLSPFCPLSLAICSVCSLSSLLLADPKTHELKVRVGLVRLRRLLDADDDPGTRHYSERFEEWLSGHVRCVGTLL